MPRLSTHRSSPEIGAEIFAALMWGPKTWPTVMAQVGLSKGNASQWLRQLWVSGVIRVSGYIPQEDGRGRQVRVFALQTKPFELPDEPYPSAHPRRKAARRAPAVLTQESIEQVRKSELNLRDGCAHFGISRSTWYRIRGFKTERTTPRRFTFEGFQRPAATTNV